MMHASIVAIARTAAAAAVLPVILLLNGCSFGPPPREAAVSYDLGPQSIPAPLSSVSRLTLRVPEASAPAWLDGTGIVYRLNYADPARPQVYAQSRWVDSPAALLTQRIRTRFAAVGPVVNGRDGARADYALQVEIEDFSQIFDGADSSKVSVRLRVTLVNLAGRSLQAQRSFGASQPSEPDAKGAVRAFARTTDALLEDILEWAKSSLKGI